MYFAKVFAFPTEVFQLFAKSVTCFKDSDFGDDDKDKRWSRAARVLLIREIQARPALWAEQSDDHRNPLRRELKREVARVVSTKLGFTVTCMLPISVLILSCSPLKALFSPAEFLYSLVFLIKSFQNILICLLDFGMQW